MCNFLGTIDNFKPLIENLDHGKYTIVVWDAPGVGKSRPPDRDYSPGYLYREADYAIALMEVCIVNIYKKNTITESELDTGVGCLHSSLLSYISAMYSVYNFLVFNGMIYYYIRKTILSGARSF